MKLLACVKCLKFLVIISVIVLVVGIYYSFFGEGDAGVTGFVIDEGFLDDFLVNGSKYENLVGITKGQALDSLVEAEEIVNEMIGNSLPSIFMNDKLLEAKRVFEQAEYATILRGETNASEAEELKAKEALRLLDWENTTYDDVIIYTNQIKKRRDRTFVLYDSLIATKISLLREGGVDPSITGMVTLTESVNESTGEKTFILDPLENVDEETKELFDEVTVAFYEDRDDAIDLLVELKEHLEVKRLESATANVLKNNLASFMKRHWVAVLAFLLILAGVIYVVYKNITYRELKEKIEKMEVEKDAILQLVKRLQRERFKENKISELVYKIRMKKYKSRLLIIKSSVPVLKLKLEKLGDRKIVVNKLVAERGGKKWKR